MDDVTKSIGAIVAAVIGLAIVAVIVSKNAQTSGVIGSAGTALSGVISAAVSPVSGTGAVTGASALQTLQSPLIMA